MKRPQRRSKQKPKSEIMPADALSREEQQELANNAKYCGSPYHKKYPDDYDMPDLPKPRPDKTRCDGTRSICREEAMQLLRCGFEYGMVSNQRRQGWPQNVWAVDEEGVVYEAQLQNAPQGEYHGYPMKIGDDFAEVVRQQWENRKK